MDEIIDLRELRDEGFIIHFGGQGRNVDATTFSHTLLSLSEALKTINYEINPGHDIDLLIEDVGSGSFRALLRVVKRSAENIFSTQTLIGTVIIGVFVNYISDKMFPNDPIITIKADDVIVEYGGKTVIVPRNVHDIKERVSRNETFKRHAADTIKAVEKDDKVTSFGFTSSMTDRTPSTEIPRALFPQVINAINPSIDVAERVVDVEAELVIVKAILQRSNRKWEFIWNGITVSATISDHTFFDRLIAREIAVVYGDLLLTRLRIFQKRDEITGAWLNKRYEVVRVHASKSRPPDQLSMPNTP